MTSILIPDDLEKYISSYNKELYSYLNNSIYIELISDEKDKIDKLKQQIYSELEIQYELMNTNDNLNNSKKYYLKQFILNTINY